MALDYSDSRTTMPRAFEHTTDKILAPAKLNLRLRVVGRRSDGYHLLEMLNTTVDICDRIEIAVTQERGVRLEVEGDTSGELSDAATNLAARAAVAFFDCFGIERGARIALQKIIPMGAGMGGGSSDAAAVLSALFRLAELTSDQAALVELRKLALSLGADVPFFLGGPFSIVQGIGEDVFELDPAVVRNWECLVVKPQFSINTAQLFAHLRRRMPTIPRTEDHELRQFYVRIGGMTEENQRTALLDLVRNDLEEAIVETAPQLGEILECVRRFRGVVASVTGSGSALFVLPRVFPAFDASLAAEINRKVSTLGCKCMPAKLAPPIPL